MCLIPPPPPPTGTAEYGFFRRDLECARVKSLVCKCAFYFRCATRIPHFSVSTYIIFFHHEKFCTKHYDNWKMFAMKFKLTNYTTPYYAIQHPTTPISGCAVSFEKKSQVCTCQALQSGPVPAHSGSLWHSSMKSHINIK